MIAEASDGREAVAEFLAHRPDIGLLDVRMPIMDGVEAVAAIREKEPAAQLVILSIFDDEEDIYRALLAGARGYLLKSTPADGLVECIGRQGQDLYRRRLQRNSQKGLLVSN